MSNAGTDDQDFQISSYSFRTFDTEKTDKIPNKVEKYELSRIHEGVKQTVKLQKKLADERVAANNNQFKISPIVLEHRGIRKKEQEETEKKITEEVEKRIVAIQEQVMRKAYTEGLKMGQEEVYNQTRAQTEEKMASLSSMIDEVLKQKEEIFIDQKQQIYTLIKNLTKWIILRELTDDGKYLERLMEKLINEMQTKAGLLIQVSQKDFEKMPEVLETVQKKIGELPNVRVEIDYDIQGQGMIIDCANGIIKGTLPEQFQSLDKLFESVEKK
ncbi:MAG: FliH/SctL family protein [Pseudomonadota bacterium]